MAPPGTEAVGKVGEKAMSALNSGGIGGKVIQVVIGLVLVLIIYYIAITIMNSDSLTTQDPFDTDIKRQVPIIDGFADTSQISGNVYNTVTPFASNSLIITPSSNIKGGAQFTYSLWMNIGDGTNSQRGKTIFMKGDAKKYTYSVTDTMTNVSNTLTDYVAFCPCLSFGTNLFDFVVRFNTADNMNEQLYIQNVNNTNDLYRKHMLSLMTGKWFLITIVFEDNIPINDFEDGLVVKFYINDQLYSSGTYSSMLRQNNGNFYLFPNGPISKTMVSNMFYYNYALGTDEIRNLYTQGPSNKSTSTVSTSFISPLMMNDKNRLDIYNA